MTMTLTDSFSKKKYNIMELIISKPFGYVNIIYIKSVMNVKEFFA